MRCVCVLYSHFLVFCSIGVFQTREPRQVLRGAPADCCGTAAWGRSEVDKGLHSGVFSMFLRFFQIQDCLDFSFGPESGNSYLQRYNDVLQIVGVLMELMKRHSKKNLQKEVVMRTDPAYMQLVQSIIDNCKTKEMKVQQKNLAIRRADDQSHTEHVCDFPSLRSFVPVDKVTEKDLQVRSEILGIETAKDPLRTVWQKHLDATQKKQEKRRKEKMFPKEKHRTKEEAEDSEGGSDEANQAPEKLLWPMPEKCSAKVDVVVGDLFAATTPIPKKKYRLVTVDGPYGLYMFKGDQEWPMDVVSQSAFTVCPSCFVNICGSLFKMCHWVICVYVLCSTRMLSKEQSWRTRPRNSR